MNVSQPPAAVTFIVISLLGGLMYALSSMAQPAAKPKEMHKDYAHLATSAPADIIAFTPAGDALRYITETELATEHHMLTKEETTHLRDVLRQLIDLQQPPMGGISTDLVFRSQSARLRMEADRLDQEEKLMADARILLEVLNKRLAK